MGIRGFGPAIQRYGVFSPLSGDTVVIDGPALVHRISEGCVRQRASGAGFVCHPSYSVLGRMMIGWLDELRSHNVKVRKIYFDGYLPPSKWETRRERLLEQSRNMKALLSSHPLGSSRSPENAFEDLKPEISLTQTIGRSRFEKLPKSPFMVPAVIETLRNCQYWGPLVEVVPGEADMFCAQDVRQNGGAVLTSDSDLLVQDLGLEGNVSFFWDVVQVDPADKALGLTACKMSFYTISGQLGLTNTGGLTRLAFEKVNGNMRFNEALEKARSNDPDTLNSPEFRSFEEEHGMKEYIPSDHPVLGILSTLDPRISEVVIQTLVMKGEGTVPDAPTAKACRGPETLSMFLPIMIEDRDRRSAWTMSTAIREIAYGVLQNSASQRSTKIIEYRMLDSSTALTGRQVDVPGPDETIDQCDLLVETLDNLDEKIALPEMRWFTFAVYQDIERSTSEGRSPISAMLINKSIDQTDNNTKGYSWDLIHFAAQVQASLYSLRMAKQVLDVAVALGQDLAVPLQRLQRQLQSLPLIAEWPLVEGMSSLLSSLRGAHTLPIIAEILGIPSLETAEIPAEYNKSRKRRKRNHKQLHDVKGQVNDGRSPSLNPFALLSQASQD